VKNKNLDVNFCDFCSIDSTDAKDHVGTDKCAICGKWACPHEKCPGRLGGRDPTEHFPRSYSCGAPLYPFICANCWAKARQVPGEQIRRGIPLNASGDSWSIRLGEYITRHHVEFKKQLNEIFVDEIRRLIELGKGAK